MRPPVASLTVSNRPGSSATFVLISAYVNYGPPRRRFGVTAFACRGSPSRSVLAGHAREGWQARRESNPQPPVLETGALPIELLAYLVSLCAVCFLQYLQYLLSSRRSVVFFRFFDVL